MQPAIVPAVAAAPRETVAQRTRRLAAALVNTPAAPAGHELIRQVATEAKAYFDLNPYPWYHFQEWKCEERGPYPRCMPFIRGAVKRGSRWLFRRAPQIQCPGNPELETYLREAWQANRMPTRMVAAAEKAGYQGGIALKFSYDETAVEVGAPALSIQTLSVIDELRCYYDPHDRDRLLLARVQYPYWDPVERCWLLYREEWTAEEEIHYRPVPCEWAPRWVSGIAYPPVAVVSDGRADPESYTGWQIVSQEANPFGLIPITPIKNLDCEEAYGVGDLWGLYRVIDRVNLTYHGMDKSNQFDSEPNLIFLDIDAEQTDIDRPLAPGQPLSVKSDENGSTGDNAKGQVIMAEAKGNLRPAMMEYAKDLRKQVLAAASSVEVDQEEITNQGNLTQAVLTQIYGPLIEITDEKRKTYGEDGLSKFLENVAVGLSHFGRVPEIRGVDRARHATHDVQLKWPEYFALSEDEKTAKLTRTTAEVGAGLMTHERAIETVAVLEGIEDVDALKDELEPVASLATEGLKQKLGRQPEPELKAPGAPGGQ